MASAPAHDLEVQSFLHIGLTLLGLFAMLAVYVGVPALLGWLAGIRLERIGLGVGPVVLQYRGSKLHFVLGSIPIGAHAKFYGEEGLFGVRAEDWPANRGEADEAEDADDEPADEEDDDRPEEPPPPDSFVAAHPLVRAAVSLSGPVSLGLVGLALLWLSARVDGPPLHLIARGELPEAIRQNRDARPWSEFPLFGDLMAVPGDLAPEVGDADLLPDGALRAAESALKFAALSASPEGYAGYMSWPMLLVRSLEPGPAFCLAVFGLFAFLVAVVNLLPAPFLQGGVALISLIEWTTGYRPPGNILRFAELLGYMWFFVLIIQLMSVDVTRFG